MLLIADYSKYSGITEALKMILDSFIKISYFSKIFGIVFRRHMNKSNICNGFVDL